MMTNPNHTSHPRSSGLRTQANQRQQQAADPTHTVFVSANAGTGKTRVLTNRVLRLLLSGISPDTILCVTYTKAAAAEMQHRLSQALQNWAVCSTETLYQSLKEIGELNPTEQQVKTARRLFALILDFDDSPRIETVHSFCQKILMRFPVEARIPPFFDLIADSDADMLLQDCFLELVADSYRRGGVLGDAVKDLSDHISDTLLSSSLSAVLKDRHLIDKLANHPTAINDFIRHLADEKGYFSPDQLTAFEQKMACTLSEYGIEELALRLEAGGKRASGRAELLRVWLSLDTPARIAGLDIVRDALLSAKHTRLKDVADNAVRKMFPDFDQIADPILDMLEELCDARASVLCRQLSIAVSRLAAELYKRYQLEKRKRSVLDYDDLIFYTHQLLNADQMMEWVRWKLDQGINHILVDEAQDTSPQQWQLLERLTESFFDGTSEGVNSERTLFVVGDYKQSIYSFQGARPDVFANRRHHYQHVAQQAQRPFRSIPFSLSFRSSGAVLSFVDSLLSRDEMDGFGAEIEKHGVDKADMAGLVELWDYTRGQEADKPAGFSVPEVPSSQRADARHAQRIAVHVKHLIKGSHHDVFAKDITAGDILILVHKRNSFYAMLRAELQAQGIAVAGADRVKLNNQIEVLDLLALADICLFPDDDLQLACVLKSPLLGLDEDDLFELATKRNQRSLYDMLMQHEGSKTRFGRAAERIRHYQVLAEQKPVFEFFSTVLAEGGRDAFYRRLGPSIDDSLNAFLQRARDHSTSGPRTSRTGLAHFIKNFRQSGGEIKRDLDARSLDQVRVMTIHGAKGLEAPIVYLPDTLRDRPQTEQILSTDEGAYWVSSETSRLAEIDDLKTASELTRKQENQRLLYVALTRAQQALFISGWEQKSSRFSEGSWYELMRKALLSLPDVHQEKEGVWRLKSGKAEGLSSLAAPAEPSDKPPLDFSWFYQTPPAAPAPARPLTPSDIEPHDGPAGFGNADRKTALLCGQLAHKLLEVLPSVTPERRKAVAHSLAQHFHKPPPKGLSEHHINEVLAQTQKVLSSPSLSDLFSTNAFVEVPVSGLVGSVAITGQLDRMLVTENKVMVIDFKTGTPPPEGVRPPQRYINQMAAYRALLMQIYPDRPVDCYLLWCQNQGLSYLNPTECDTAVTQLLNRET